MDKGTSKHEKEGTNRLHTMRKKWANSLRKCTAYSNVDHRIVTANIKISLKTPRKQSKSSISDFSALRTFVELQEQYSVEISTRFAALDENIYLHQFRMNMIKLSKS